MSDAKAQAEKDKQAVTDAQAKEDAAKAAKDAADKKVADLESQTGDLSKLEQAMNDAKKASDDAAKTAADKAQAAKDAEGAKNTADNAKTAAQSDADAKKGAADTAKKQLAQGSLGFFEDRGSDKAVDTLKNNKYAQYLHIGDKTSATDLDNMIKALDFLDKVNTIRKSLGLSELKVSDNQTALAEIATDYNGYLDTLQHLAYTGGQNLAGGTTDPVYYWYTTEKKVYDAHPEIHGKSRFWIQMNHPELAQKVGHYLTIVDPSYTLTGGGYTAAGEYNPVTGQNFSADESDTGVTVAQFRQAILDYRKNKDADIKAYSDAQAKLADAAKAAQDAADALTRAERASAQAQSDASAKADAYAKAKAAYDKAVADQKDQAAALAAAKADRKAKTEAYDKAKADTKTAQAKADESDRRVTAAEGEVTAREQAVKDAEAKLKDAEAVVDGYAKAEQALKDAQQAYDEAVKALDVAKADQKTAHAALDDAAAKAKTAGEAYDKAKGAYDEAKTASDKADAHVKALEAAAKKAEDEKKEAAKKAEEAKKKAEEARRKAANPVVTAPKTVQTGYHTGGDAKPLAQTGADMTAAVAFAAIMALAGTGCVFESVRRARHSDGWSI